MMGRFTSKSNLVCLDGAARLLRKRSKRLWQLLKLLLTADLCIDAMCKWTVRHSGPQSVADLLELMRIRARFDDRLNNKVTESIVDELLQSCGVEDKLIEEDTPNCRNVKQSNDLFHDVACELVAAHFEH